MSTTTLSELTVACRDQIGYAAALEEGFKLRSGIIFVGEGDHLLQSETDDSGLGIVAQAKPGNEPSSTGHDVLDRAADFNR